MKPSKTQIYLGIRISSSPDEALPVELPWWQCVVFTVPKQLQHRMRKLVVIATATVTQQQKKTTWHWESRVETKGRMVKHLQHQLGMTCHPLFGQRTSHIQCLVVHATVT